MMRSSTKWVNSLCPPARLYFIISIALMIVSILQNILKVGTTHRIGNGQNQVCVGVYDCRTDVHPILMFLVQLFYILLWSWILNMICKAGYVNLSWFILFLPFIAFFALLGLFVLMVLLEKI